jgi:predicted nucleic acid-binding protein
MAMILVDTCVWITANKRRPDGDVLKARIVLDSLLSEGVAAFCDPIRLEFLGAVRREFRERFDSMFSVVPCLPMPAGIWDTAIRLARELKDLRNLTLPWNDILIAAIAQAHGARVYSLDHHFRAMSACLDLGLYDPEEDGGCF